MKNDDFPPMDPETEARVLADPALRASLDRAMNTPRSDLRSRGSFAQYATDDDCD